MTAAAWPPLGRRLAAAWPPLDRLAAALTADRRLTALQAVLHKSTTPAQHMRAALEGADSFDGAVAFLSGGEMIDECYYILAGSAAGEGAVLSRSRSKAEDVWRLNATAEADVTAGRGSNAWPTREPPREPLREPTREPPREPTREPPPCPPAAVPAAVPARRGVTAPSSRLRAGLVPPRDELRPLAARPRRRRPPHPRRRHDARPRPQRHGGDRAALPLRPAHHRARLQPPHRLHGALRARHRHVQLHRVDGRVRYTGGACVQVLTRDARMHHGPTPSVLAHEVGAGLQVLKL